MSFFRNLFLREHVFVFGFSLAVIAGPALSVLFGNDLSQFTDTVTYTGLAELDFDQSPVRRYRILVPMFAFLLDLAFAPLFGQLAPGYYSGNFSLAFSFFLVNSLLMACLGVLVYRYCRAFGVPVLGSVTGLLVTLTARYTGYFAAFPLVDSLFCVVVAATLLGIRTKNSALLIACIFLGPFAKEAFIFIAPLIFFFSHLGRKRMLVYFILSGLLVFSFRFVYDALWPPRVVGWLRADFAHLQSVPRNTLLLLSFYGLYKILINIGFWILIPLAALLVSASTRLLLARVMDMQHIIFLIAVLFMMLLSGSIERMFYLAMPLVSLIVALCFTGLRRHVSRAV